MKSQERRTDGGNAEMRLKKRQSGFLYGRNEPVDEVRAKLQLMWWICKIC